MLRWASESTTRKMDRKRGLGFTVRGQCRDHQSLESFSVPPVTPLDHPPEPPSEPSPATRPSSADSTRKEDVRCRDNVRLMQDICQDRKEASPLGLGSSLEPYSPPEPDKPGNEEWLPPREARKNVYPCSLRLFAMWKPQIVVILAQTKQNRTMCLFRRCKAPAFRTLMMIMRMTVVYQEIHQNGAETPNIPTNCMLHLGLNGTESLALFAGEAFAQSLKPSTCSSWALATTLSYDFSWAYGDRNAA
ncbi:hypothetical protein JEQ12_010826 [Ovis aries]|uniref:Uncharacterized protein n=1 Tax=Ovis aries TaxID=9940 RepID=A0A835ZMA1_SHEEP|nr:hypothetical protein JEQ12_010826 [Ovis aries]